MNAARDQVQAIDQEIVRLETVITALRKLRVELARPTLEEIDVAALGSLSMAGEITIRQDAPPDPSVGYFGSVASSGQITGSFRIPASAVTMIDNVAHIITEDWNPGGTIIDYIKESAILDRIIAEIEGMISAPDDYECGFGLELLGVSKDGRLALIEFKIKVLEL